jgi:hypothetical protein
MIAGQLNRIYQVSKAHRLINDAKLNMGIAASLLENQPRRVGGAKKRRSNKRK